MYKIPLNQS